MSILETRHSLYIEMSILKTCLSLYWNVNFENASIVIFEVCWANRNSHWLVNLSAAYKPFVSQHKLQWNPWLSDHWQVCGHCRSVIMKTPNTFEFTDVKLICLTLSFDIHNWHSQLYRGDSSTSDSLRELREDRAAPTSGSS